MSEKKECPGCAVEIDQDARICPICHYEFPHKRSRLIWIGLFLVSLSLIFPIIALIKRLLAALF